MTFCGENKMKLRILFLILLVPALVIGQDYQKHILQKDRLSIQLTEGVLNIIPITPKAIRIQWEKNGIHEPREFILINRTPVPAFKFSENGSKLSVTTSALTVSFDKMNGVIQYRDKTGRTFLS